MSTSTPGYSFTPAGGPEAASIAVPGTNLAGIALALVSPRGRGIYATDETPEGIDARLSAACKDAGVQHKEWSEDEKRERRKSFRKCLYENLPAEHISGVILHEETLLSFSLAEPLLERGIIPGVRADTDSHSLPSSPEEPATQGLDDLLPRLRAARAAGALFTKWRAPLLCTEMKYPTHAAVNAQAEALARFASIAQMAGLVPIVEPDVDFAGDASLERSAHVHEWAISEIYHKCQAYGVKLEGMLIKPSFPQPGLKHGSHGSTTAQDIAYATARVLSRTLPVAVPGVVFLSGGLTDDTSAAYLASLNNLVASPPAASGSMPDPFAASFLRLPPLSFSFGRGLQGDAMRKWVAGDEAGARDEFVARAKVCWKAAGGT